MPARSRVIPSYEYRRTRWRNGTGWTREIHAEPGIDGADWDWRLSIAEITADGPFSTLPGVDRELVLLAGEGVRLRFDDGVVADVLPPYGRHRFAGEVAVHGELVDGPTHDFNLMWRRERYAAELWRRPLVGAMVVFAEPQSTWIVHQLAGHTRFADGSGLPDLAMADTAILQAGDARLRHVLDGAGEALLIRLTPADAPSGAGLSLESED
ncbi:HutD/Ves family protein [Lysobacter sp. HA35]